MGRDWRLCGVGFSVMGNDPFLPHRSPLSSRHPCPIPMSFLSSPASPAYLLPTLPASFPCPTPCLVSTVGLTGHPSLFIVSPNQASPPLLSTSLPSQSSSYSTTSPLSSLHPFSPSLLYSTLISSSVLICLLFPPILYSPFS